MDESDINTNQLTVTMSTGKKELTLPEVKKYYRIVKETVPSGLISSIQVQNKKYGKKAASLVHKKQEDNHLYMVPLVRNLLSYEANLVKRELEKAFDFDFEIKYSETNVVPASVASDATPSKKPGK